jgi:hypothetical protein
VGKADCIGRSENGAGNWIMCSKFNLFHRPGLGLIYSSAITANYAVIKAWLTAEATPRCDKRREENFFSYHTPD